MNIVLSHYSALAFWIYAALPNSRLHDFSFLASRRAEKEKRKRDALLQSDFHSPLLKTLFKKERLPLPRDSRLSISKDERAALCNLLNIPFSLQTIGLRNDKRRSDLKIEVHENKSYLTLKQIINVVPGLSVCSPELAFIQLSSELDATKLTYLGFEMCGTYSVTPYPNNMLQARRPLCTVKSIRDVAGKVTRIGNQSKLKAALEIIRDGAASPPESQLIQFLTTPCSKGGAGFEAPQPNGIVLTNANDRKISGKLWRACDLYWSEDRVAIEYDSEMYHASIEQRCNDAIRRNALVSAGIKILSVTPGQLHDYKEMLRVEAALAKALNRRQRTRVEDYAAKHKRFHKEISNYCPQWRSTLFKDEDEISRADNGSFDEQGLASECEGHVYGRAAKDI